MLARLRIRGKLGLLLIAPMLGMVGLTVPVVVERVDVAERADDTVRAVEIAGQVGSLAQDLQLERMLSIGYLFKVVDRSRLVLQSATVTDAVADLRALSDLPAGVATALDAQPALATIRAAVLRGDADPEGVLAAFATEVTRLIDGLRLRHSADTTTAEGKQVMALDSVLRADEGVSLVATRIVMIAATSGQLGTGSYVSSMAALRAESDRFREYATVEQNRLYDLVQKGADNRAGQDFLARFATNPAQTVQGVTIGQLFPIAESQVTLGRFIEKKIVTDVVAEVGNRQRRALTEAYGVALVCILILLCVLLLSVAVARAVARPLTRLTQSAESVAQVAEAELTKVSDGDIDAAVPVRLEAVDVRARDEVGDLARAFERVQATAARLVERQVASRRNVAQMFGHVGRRTQNLVGRQLALIDRLERQETDPGRLQSLYRLDHISSRLRRSASSLVVISETPGADSHVAPLPLTDVVRLALGEIEDYLRVDIKVPTEISMSPALIGDLVLALAELMENATTFSPPHTRVTVTAVVTDPGVRLLVVDHGLGMSAERMAEENARLARRERLDLVPTEVLGLFVVGRLARRHGMRVTLTTTPGGGVTVEVEVDERLLVLNADEPRVVAVARARVGGATPVSGAPVSGASVSGASPVGGPTAQPALPTAVPPVPMPEWPIRQRTAGPGESAIPVNAGQAATHAEPATDSDAGADSPVRGTSTASERSEALAARRLTPLNRRRPSAAAMGPDTDALGFDNSAIHRASRMLASGQPWNAFAPPESISDDQPVAENDPGPAGPESAPAERAEPTPWAATGDGSTGSATGSTVDSSTAGDADETQPIVTAAKSGSIATPAATGDADKTQPIVTAAKSGSIATPVATGDADETQPIVTGAVKAKPTATSAAASATTSPGIAGTGTGTAKAGTAGTGSGPARAEKTPGLRRRVPGARLDGPDQAQSGSQGKLRQRVPGAQLTPEESNKPASSAAPTPVDAIEARSSVEEFEAGVRYAERQVRSGNTPARRRADRHQGTNPGTAGQSARTAPATTPTSGPASAGGRATPNSATSPSSATSPRSTSTPSGATNGSADAPPVPAENGNGTRTPRASTEGEAQPARPLSRRQPGATLDDTASVPAERRTSDQPPNADEARELVQQFESGVARAMRQISAGLRDEEGSSR